jgi:YfiH family protein
MSAAPYLTHPRLELPGVRHAFFTRRGGVSKGIYDSLNLGLGSRDDPEAVRENRRRAAAAFDLGPDRLLTCHQVHSPTVVTVDEPFPVPPEADGSATATAGLICGALSADCAPILMADPEAGVVAAVHAGWKGALTGAAEAGVQAMEGLGAEVSRIVAVIGPCIGPRSYEVGLDFLERFAAEDPDSARFFRLGVTADKRMFDLPAYVIERLSRAGVEGAEWLGRDTCAEEADFFSNRRAVKRSEGDYGRLLSAIALTS